MTNTEQKQPFWKTTTGLVIKIAGIISALTAIISFGAKSVEYIKETNDRKSEATIIKIIKNYYALDDEDNYAGIASLFDANVDDYYNKSNFTPSQIVEDCKTYCRRWPYHKNITDFSTIKVRKTGSGNYFATYQHFYKTRRKETDDWKNFNLQISIEFTKEFKIKSISERKI